MLMELPSLSNIRRQRRDGGERWVPEIPSLLSSPDGRI